jgi:hypothetical protein
LRAVAAAALAAVAGLAGTAMRRCPPAIRPPMPS